MRYIAKEQLLQTAKLQRPNWIRAKTPSSADIGYHETIKIARSLKLNTVCEEAACPNIGECWSKKHATMMILGSVCTRNCRFCNITTGKPDLLDPHEPERVANAVLQLGLAHVVITSVDRDDLHDGGAMHFAECIAQIRKLSPSSTIEVLTPDFLRKANAAEIVIDAKPDVYNHNIETVPSLYSKIRPGARYYNSISLLDKVKRRDQEIFTKSGIMLGLGETNEEVIQVMDDLRIANVDFLTIGQYLQPTGNHAPVMRYASQEEFKYLGQVARAKGFLVVSSSPMTRSSYHAGDDFLNLKRAREKALALSNG